MSGWVGLTHTQTHTNRNTDGFNRLHSNRGVVRLHATGELCHVVGRVSMDAITVRVPASTTLATEFRVYSADFDSQTSMSGRAAQLGTIGYEVSRPVPACVTAPHTCF